MAFCNCLFSLHCSIVVQGSSRDAGLFALE
jgi:hypothetical protein